MPENWNIQELMRVNPQLFAQLYGQYVGNQYVDGNTNNRPYYYDDQQVPQSNGEWTDEALVRAFPEQYGNQNYGVTYTPTIGSQQGNQSYQSIDLDALAKSNPELAMEFAMRSKLNMSNPNSNTEGNIENSTGSGVSSGNASQNVNYGSGNTNSQYVNNELSRRTQRKLFRQAKRETRNLQWDIYNAKQNGTYNPNDYTERVRQINRVYDSARPMQQKYGNGGLFLRVLKNQSNNLK